MTLKEFLSNNKIQIGAFADLIGTSRRSVEYYLEGRVPRKNTLQKIQEVTDGQVTPNDFFTEVQ